MERNRVQTRAIDARFEKRDEGDPKIEGYFAVYNSIYEIAPGMSESIAPGAFGDLNGDIRMLTNHDTTLVLGRTTAGTLTLREDENGVWASSPINPNDRAAMDTYARVQRGDVSQASIGFEIIREDTDVFDDGRVHWTIREARLFEVSVCTFPAYTETDVTARSAERDELLERRAQAWAAKMKERLRHGTNGTNAPQED